MFVIHIWISFSEVLHELDHRCLVSIELRILDHEVRLRLHILAILLNLWVAGETYAQVDTNQRSRGARSRDFIYEAHVGAVISNAVSFIAGVNVVKPLVGAHQFGIGIFVRQKTTSNENGILEGAPYFHEDEILQIALPLTYRYGRREFGRFFATAGVSIDVLLSGQHEGGGELTEGTYAPIELMGIAGAGLFFMQDFLLEAQLHLPISDPFPSPQNAESFKGEMFGQVTFGARLW